MPELVTIPNSFFEYTAEYERPIISLWLERAKIVQAVYDALSPWNVRPENIEAKNEGKPVEQGFLIRIPNKGVTFFFGPVKFRFSITGADWQQLEDIISLIDTALTALLQSSGSTVKNQKTVIGLHMQPKSKAFREVLLPFWPEAFLKFYPGEATTGAVILKWRNAGITIDGSGTLANGVFLKIERDFASTISYTEIAEILREDEVKALAILDVEEELA